MAMEYELTEEADAEALSAAVRRGIRDADPSDVGPRDWRPLTLALRARDGTLMGGLCGATMWGWLTVDGLWVAEELRGRGLGQRLLLTAEAAAVARGCRGARLGTFDFQARGFYERLGYIVFGELPDFPAGHTNYELWKSLAAPAQASCGGAEGGAGS
jgi:ribosomal protein S18 acetylase RimI-like enzyme